MRALARFLFFDRTQSADLLVFVGLTCGLCLSAPRFPEQAWQARHSVGRLKTGERTPEKPA